MYQLEWLKDNGVTDVAVVMPQEEAERIQSDWSEAFTGLRIHYFSDPVPRGPAGCIKQCEEFVGGHPFCVMNGNLYLRSLDLRRFMRHHLAVGGVATLGVVVAHDPTQDRVLENLLAGEDGAIRGFDIPHSSRDRRHPMQFAGIYAFRPEVFQHIPEKGFVDIKEQLLPMLSQMGLTVNVHQFRGFHMGIDSLSEYFRLQHTVLQQGLFDESRFMPLGDRVWCDKGAKVSSSAHVIGPVVLGRDCVIEDHAYVIGPTVIGDGTRVLENSLVRESILGESVTVSKFSKIEYAIVGEQYVTKEYGRTRDCVVTCDQPPAKLMLADSMRIWPKRKPVLPRAVSCGYRKFFKRALDAMVATLAFIVALPFMVLIAIAIKLDSPGPVLFRQRRSGLGGREFGMIKFRTMCDKADVLQKKLWTQKTVDGPMFKMESDPRVTRVGKFLRSSSLDELPQLFNVLRSEMSLVGPRPLAMGEMRFSPSWRDARLSVKPGITGLWQVNGRSQAAFHDWIHYDMHYVRNYSLRLDLKILMQTILVVARRAGAQ